MRKPRLLLALALMALPAVTDGAAGWGAQAGDAPLQVVARCEARSSRWEGGAIFSYSELSVSRVVRGVPDHVLVVRQRGGSVDGIGQRVSHAALLEPGQRYLLFLEPDESGAWTPTSKGVNEIVEQADLSDTVAGEPLDEVIGALGAAN
ncbi:MAG: hypothetical protein HYY35_01925 [Deltaproteobacteria bacterium]|nr:hypothetical protein [Deltaproteobacteria bacterium]